MEQGTDQSPVWGLKKQLAQVEHNGARSSSQAMITNDNEGQQGSRAKSKIRRMTVEGSSIKIQQV